MRRSQENVLTSLASKISDLLHGADPDGFAEDLRAPLSQGLRRNP